MNKFEEKQNILKDRENFKNEMDKFRKIKNHYLSFIILSLIFAIFISVKFMLWYLIIPFIIISIILYFKRIKYVIKFKANEFVYVCTFASEEILNNDIDLEDDKEVVDYLKDLDRKSVV